MHKPVAFTVANTIVYATNIFFYTHPIIYKSFVHSAQSNRDNIVWYCGWTDIETTGTTHQKKWLATIDLHNAGLRKS